VETQLIHPTQLKPDLGRIARELRLRGVTLYVNLPLLGYINDSGQEVLGITSGCRALGIELGSVIVTGLPVQQDWNSQNPIELNSVIDIATYVRRHGSGREVPRYLLLTPLGEVDYAIAPRIFRPVGDDAVGVTLRPHDLAYFQRIDPDFEWPEAVTVDEDGHPTVSVGGVSLDNQEFLFNQPGR
jgi:hypothetical protein